MNAEYWKIIIPSAVASLVAFASHQLAVYRTFSEYRRKQRTEYLIAAFKAVMMNSNNTNLKEAVPALRDAAILIQFMGTQEQSTMLNHVLDTIAKHEDASLDPLLKSLRDDIRKELKLGPISSRIFWIHPKPDAYPN
jgi:hypothetical protein